MSFLEHIQQIDRRIEERREKETQKTFFGMDGDLDVEGALAMAGDFHIVQTKREPGPFGGTTRYVDGRMTSHSQSIPTGIPGQTMRRVQTFPKPPKLKF